ncbi:hypothetical protein CR205_10455 [Alteribacter lacisalsi]|uniref:Uncharacterized protein n=1 Tax=Alteribacter lacisalsi TaxID=2045244 RepID=A0A2W0HAS5_9BACI|nr:hypothetical protein [Alteribacter lacisalsi]PYZ98963.1 hypothetical protein CR205_10455 [Alteribacter lacisalsi]
MTLANRMIFSDNFFSAGQTPIFNEEKEQIGSLDLKSAFNSNVDIINQDGDLLMKGSFPVFSNQWKVTDFRGEELGSLKQNITLFSKKFEYRTGSRGTYRIEGEGFSHDYKILGEDGDLHGDFHKTSGFFEAASFELLNQSDVLGDEELIAIVMGVNMLNKRKKRRNRN